MTKEQDNYKRRILLEEQLEDNKKKKIKIEELESISQNIQRQSEYIREELHRIFTGKYNKQLEQIYHHENQNKKYIEKRKHSLLEEEINLKIQKQKLETEEN